MKKLFIAFIMTGFIGFGIAPSINANPIIETGIYCDNCKKDHKCDDKCKKGKKSKCCKQQKSKSKKCCASKSAGKTKKCSGAKTAKKATCTKGAASKTQPKAETEK